MTRSIVAVASLALVVTSCSATADVSTIGADETESAAAENLPSSEPLTGSVDWTPCDTSATAVVELECGSITVPLDHERPDGDTIEIALARSPAADDDERIGSLVFNPGGPGGSGIDFLTSAALLVPPTLSRRFDLVSFDPRGVGASAAIDCDVELDDEITLLAPGDDAGWEALVADVDDLTEDCSDTTAEIAPYVGTNNAARDLDEIRAALGDERLSYVGFSYGTRLGAAYAELFPDRVRALVLDGAVKPTDDFDEIAREQVEGFDRAFEAFADACDADDDCAPGATGSTRDVYTRLVDEIDALGSLPTDDADRVLTPGELQLGVLASLYSTQLWPIAAEGLARADSDGDGTLLQALVDTYTGRRPDGSYDNSQSAGFAINCADDPARPPTEATRADADDIAEQSQWFADLVRADTGCLGAPDPIDPVRVGTGDGAAPILVIGNTGDPATPYSWAVELADLLVSAELFTVEAEGHTAFLTIPCVEDVVVEYLVDLVMPAPGSSCADDATTDAFPAPGDSELDQALAFIDCLRENGVDIPDITLGDLLADPQGETLFEAIDPTDPAFADAIMACGSLLAGP